MKDDGEDWTNDDDHDGDGLESTPTESDLTYAKLITPELDLT